MKKGNVFTLMVCAAMALVVGGATPQANATISLPIFRSFFPPFEDTGTVIEISAGGIAEGGQTCIVFKADSNGALYFFNGLENFALGTALHVKGNLCLICLVVTTCDQPVSPIMNAKAVEI